MSTNKDQSQPPLAGADGSAVEIELRESFELAENQLAAEKLAGNIVKEHYWRGELAALHRIRRALSPNTELSHGDVKGQSET